VLHAGVYIYIDSLRIFRTFPYPSCHFFLQIYLWSWRRQVSSVTPTSNRAIYQPLMADGCGVLSGMKINSGNRSALRETVPVCTNPTSMGLHPGLWGYGSLHRATGAC
jgi:hypothetical protein